MEYHVMIVISETAFARVVVTAGSRNTGQIAVVVVAVVAAAAATTG